MAQLLDLRPQFPSKEDYSKARDFLVTKLEDNPIPGIISSILYGSMSRDELVPGWSDMDVLVIVERETIDAMVINRLLNMGTELSQSYAVPMTFKVFTEGDISFHESGTDFFHPFFVYSYARWGQKLSGKDPREIFPLQPDYPRLSEYKEFLKKKIQSEMHKLRSALTSVSPYHMFDFSHHLPQKLFLFEPEISMIFKAGKCIDAVLDCAMYFNALEGHFTGKKLETVEVFEDKFRSNSSLGCFPSACYSIRQRWGEFNFSELSYCTSQSNRFIETITKYANEQ